ncbi:bifunctional DNA-formamidopyrimidine glycosylase/DNA-(apurinic or apyrimidinic site) lyase [Corynebacterium sp.]|uniref:bifunctional DNA-formamidopyrimidine glycosylase/DNA-(apurinic or apyrimidinic site) lyase n=1 Tax=Corynebacterium sp. TaxID=1720 RepID=UPI0026DD00FA|nr:bifunctional DNA-formamidopyrimidine glycosylase/DNA-(apurinic or apyrimidinic site) lyase [Corynebacterium sp.]MDO5075852.1 bifunctional DNA-formamidopyrimidine glycosylase/DNA-(apurinic or apyrimidinic site) lyase [Corynebacterium sp.]
MPELPEVEVVRRGLDQHVRGRTIVAAEALHPRAVRHNPDLSHVWGRRIDAVERRGKFLWLCLDDGTALLVHLGMSGQMLIKDRGTEPHKHLRARAVLDDDHELWFVDQRTFGYWWAVTMEPSHGVMVPAPAAHIARDLLDPDLDLEALAGVIKSKRTEIKRILLAQEIVSGIGNIYADEMLWAARIHGRQLAHRLRLERIVELLGHGQSVMRRALAQGGTSFDALYVNVNGESGYFDVSLHAYGQHGKPCSRCGTEIQREEFANRGSHFCPQCQRRH